MFLAVDAEKKRLRALSQAKEHEVIRLRLVLEKNRRDAAKEAKRVAQEQADAEAAAEAEIAQEMQEAGEADRMADNLSQEFVDPDLLEE